MFTGKKKFRKNFIFVVSCLVLMFVLVGVFEARAANVPAKEPPGKIDTQKIILKKTPQQKPVITESIKKPLDIKKPVEILKDAKKPVKIADIITSITPETFGNLKASPRGVWKAQGERDGTFLILLSEEVQNFEQLMPSLKTYAEDVASEGYQVRLFTVGFEGTIDPFFSNIRNLKSFIRSKWLQTLKECEEGKLSKNAFDLGTGFVLIGSFPLPMVHKRMRAWTTDAESGEKKEVIYEGVLGCDLYLTDMDGTWNLLDEMGYPLVTTMDYPDIPMDHECVPGDEIHPYWTDDTNDCGKMGAKPEIWMGRINPKNAGFAMNSEFNALDEYLKANHRYRKGIEAQSPEKVEELTFKNRLIYFDDDMRYLSQATADIMSITWPGAVFDETSYAGTNHPQGYTRIVDLTNTTNKADYKERLKNGNYLWVEAFMHSAPDLHQFATEAGTENLWRAELFQGQPMKALFYYHHGCSVCKYPVHNNLGENYLFYKNAIGTLNPMAVFGNTSVGPHETGNFYVSLAYGVNIGQAQMLSQRSYARHKNWGTVHPADPGHINPKRYYSQTLLGDPTLRPRLFSPVLAPIPPKMSSVYATVNQNMTEASFQDLGKLKLGANTAASLDTVMKKALKPGKVYPVVTKEGSVVDPLWQDIGIPVLENKAKSLKIKDMVDFDIKKVKIDQN